MPSAIRSAATPAAGSGSNAGNVQGIAARCLARNETQRRVLNPSALRLPPSPFPESPFLYASRRANVGYRTLKVAHTSFFS